MANAQAAPADKSEKPTARIVAGVNIDKLKDDDLAELHAALGAEIDARKERVTTDFIADVKAKAGKLGLDAATIAALLTPRTSRKKSGDKRSAVAAKYRNPANPSETWAGRGAKPMWVRAALEAGKKLDDLKIS